MENHNYYVVIPAYVLMDTTLSDKQKLLIGLISNLSNIKGYCFSSNKYLAECLQCSEVTIRQNIADLEERKFLTRVIKLNDKGELEFRTLTIIDPLIKSNYPPDEKQSPPLIKNNHPPLIKNNHIITKKINNKEEKEEYMSSSGFTCINPQAELIENIVNYLNKKASKNFKSSSGATVKLIKARLNEKYTFDDFKKVIDIKTSKWLHNEKMRDFLRPETLFHGTKFEGYLQETPDSETYSSEVHLNLPYPEPIRKVKSVYE